MMPFLTSSARPAPVMVAPKTTVWAKMPGDQELAVARASPGRVDRAAEDVGEQQHEHDRRQRREHQQVGHPLDLDQVALGDDQAVGHGRGRRSSASISSAVHGAPASFGVSSAACPVSVRNTSSRVGRRSADVVEVDRARRRGGAGPRRAPGAPPVTGHQQRPACARRPWRAHRRASWTSVPASARAAGDRATVTSRRSPPTCALSSSAVPWAIDLAVVDDDDRRRRAGRPPRGTAW